MTTTTLDPSTARLADGRYIVISSDGHAGGQMHEYREYLEARYLDEFDEWAKSFVNPFVDLRGETAYRNWDSQRRLQELEDDGVVAEVLFPNTIPPFFPSGNLTARQPDADAYELRWAGLKAHNRWLADFCADTPGRRAGMAQILLNDVDNAVEEIHWAKEHGLFGGVLLPGVPPDSGLEPLFADVYEPIWAACEDARHADQQPLRRRRARQRPAPRVDGDLHGRARMVLPSRVLAHGARWRVRQAPGPQAHPDGTVVGLGAAGARHARPPVRALL